AKLSRAPFLMADLSFTNQGSSAASPDASTTLNNAAIAASVGSNALTVALKTKAGTDATSADVVQVAFRSATQATGTYVVRSITGALSVVVSSGSTLGHLSALSQYIYV